jgi:hypothetical protein
MLLVNVAFGGLAGGAFALGVLWLWHAGLSRPGWMMLLVVLVAALGVFAAGALQSDGGHPEPPRPPVPPGRGPGAPEPEPWYSSTTRNPPVAAPAPKPTFAPLPPAPQPEPEPPVPPAVDEYELPGARRAGAGRVRRVVQCPSCGDFGVDLYRTPPSFVFTCRRCDHRWQWAPGQPWPATVVRPPVPSSRPS